MSDNLISPKNNFDFKDELGVVLRWVLFIFHSNKTLLITLGNNQIIIISLNPNSIFHCLGLNRISFINQTKSKVLTSVANKSKKFYVYNVFQRNNLSKVDKFFIKEKWRSFIKIFKYFEKIITKNEDLKNETNINLWSHLKIYKIDKDKSNFLFYLIYSDKVVLVLETNYVKTDTKRTFYNAHILSLRSKVSKKVLDKATLVKIISINLMKKSTLDFVLRLIFNQ